MYTRTQKEGEGNTEGESKRQRRIKTRNGTNATKESAGDKQVQNRTWQDITRSAIDRGPSE
jgi:hypothetical protein